jgi:putative endonuclease
MRPTQAGRLAERRALRLLQERGWRPLVCNWRCRWGELDLLLAKPGRLLLVEVKGRGRCGADGWGAAAVRRGKRRRLERALLCWLGEHPDWGGAGVEVVVALVPLPPRRGPVRWLRLPGL